MCFNNEALPQARYLDYIYILAISSPVVSQFKIGHMYNFHRALATGQILKKSDHLCKKKIAHAAAP